MQNQIFIGNLAFAATEMDLEDAFRSFGEILEVKIPTDKMTGRARGFAFVTFETEDSAKDALSFDGKEIKGRPVKVNMAQKKRTN